LALSLRALITKIFNSPDNIGLSTDNFLITSISSTSNEIPTFFFFFSSDEEENDNLFFFFLFLLNSKTTFILKYVL
jgi:hypothetical protein